MSANGDAPFLRAASSAGAGAREAWPRGLVRWAVIGAMVAGLLATLVHLKQQAAPTTALSFDRAAFVAASGPAPPPDDTADWKPVTLTDDWWQSRPETAEGWYRIDLDLRVAPIGCGRSTCRASA